jgi:hypothetical protein
MNTVTVEDRAQSLIKLIIKFKVFMRTEEMTYSDKAETITFIGSNLFKILHSYKIDDKLYEQAQKELLSSIVSMKDEKSIDFTYKLLLDYLETVAKTLTKCL